MNEQATALRLRDKVIVIVGGTSGLGLSAALACRAAGACVVALGRNVDKCEHLQQQLGVGGRVVAADAREQTAAEQAIALAVREFGRLDGLYHVAGGSGRALGDGPLHEVSADGWQRTLEWNLSSVYYSNRSAVQQLLRQNQGGSILNMASVLPTHPSPRYFATHAYAAAKAAIIGLTTAAAAYYAPHGIRFNAVAPALVQTPMAQRAANDPAIRDYVARKQPLDGGRIGVPQDLDGAVLFLLSDESNYVTGQTLAVDGGWSVTDAGA
jgi:NAD(P)-dependent dehydrogenase (short-subunit alcohol dehydrogenase family)